MSLPHSDPVLPDNDLALPRGDLVRSRVVPDAAVALALVLDRRLTGYAVFEPQESLLQGGDAAGVVTFEAGIPVLAYDVTTDSGGRDALDAFARPGPYHVDLYELAADTLATVHDTPELTVSPGLPAERLAGDTQLAERTREAAPDDRLVDDPTDPVTAFLADDDRIAAIREQAREEARSRATDWGLTDTLVDAEPTE